jgi:hypothetical protein
MYFPLYDRVFHAYSVAMHKYFCTNEDKRDIIIFMFRLYIYMFNGEQPESPWQPKF